MNWIDNMSGINYNKNNDGKLVKPKRDAWYTDDAWDKEWKEYEAALAALPPPKPIENNYKTWNKVDKNVSHKSSQEYPSLDASQKKKTSKKQQKQEMIEEMASIEIKIQEVVEVVKTDTKKSKMCKHVLNGKKCLYTSCHFAHSTDELMPTHCSYANNCRFKTTTCCFIHPGESKDIFVQRLGLPAAHKEEQKPIEVQRVIGTQDEVFSKLAELRKQGFQHFKVSIK